MPRDEALTDTDRLRMKGRYATLELERPLRFLTPKEIDIIDEFLATFESQGELRLVVQKGRLRFVTRTSDHEVAPDGE